MDEMKVASEGQMEQPSVRKSLEGEKVSLEKRLAMISEALETLDAHPEVDKVLEVLSKLRGFRGY